MIYLKPKKGAPFERSLPVYGQEWGRPPPPPFSETGTVGVADGSFYLNSINIGLTRATNSKTKHGTISSFLPLLEEDLNSG